MTKKAIKHLRRTIFSQNTRTILLYCSVILMITASYLYGVNSTSREDSKVLIVTHTKDSKDPRSGLTGSSRDTQIDTLSDNSSGGGSLRKSDVLSAQALSPKECLFIGSTRGSKYYHPRCTQAHKIKAENLRCFRSHEEAHDHNYTKSESCSYDI